MSVFTKAPFRVLCDGMKGENYWTHGCMAYAAACLGLPAQYDYQFFNCYAGDSVTLIFSKDPRQDVWYFTRAHTEEGLQRCFHAMGYDHIYIKDITDANRADFYPKIRDSLDRGLPVLARGGSTDALAIEWNCIVGYDADTLWYLICDRETAEPVPQAAFKELVFICDRISKPVSVAEGYREAVMRVPELLTRPANDRYSYGIQAFYDWAKQLTDGSLAQVPEEDLSIWNVHGTYLCMLGSNGGGYGLFEQVLEYFPEFSFIKRILPCYARLSEIFETLAYRDGGVCGGFDMTKADVRRPEVCAHAAALITEAAKISEDIVHIYDGVRIGETLVDTIVYKDVVLEVIQMDASIWAGKLGFAQNLTDEPDIGGLSAAHDAVQDLPLDGAVNPAFSVCISIDYWRNGAVPRGMMFGRQVSEKMQAEMFDVYEMPASLYIRLEATAEIGEKLFGRPLAGIWELFDCIRTVMKMNGYEMNDNGAQEFECYGEKWSGAYVQVKKV